jgi:16S rRNA (guanine966-N2)-methyltransferase
MRIIAGEHRGRRIEAPAGRGTRPMLDRVREALFSTLGERIAGAAVLDLFAGTGSLALEALSRGARSARLVERDPAALRALRDNVTALDMGERAEVTVGDALSRGAWSEGPYDVVFVDPPYRMLASGETRALVLGALREILATRLAPHGVVILHVPRGEVSERELARALGPHASARCRGYGTSDVWYFAPERGEREA